MTRPSVMLMTLVLCLCVAPCWSAEKARPSTQVMLTVELAKDGSGSLEMVIRTDPGRAAALAEYLQRVEGDEPLVEMLLAQTQELRTALARTGLIKVSVTQSVAQESPGEDVQRTRVTAHLAHLKSLDFMGGGLRLSEVDSSLQLAGTVGGRRAKGVVDTSALADVEVALTFIFPGSIEVRDAGGTRDHAGRSVTYTWRADELLAHATEVDVHVTPDLEEDSGYWLVLILVVTALVVLGAFIILQKGAGATEKKSEE